MTYSKLVEVKPETEEIIQLHLEDGNMVRIWGTKKQLRKAVAGGNLNKVTVVYNPKMLMLKEDWQLIQPVLSQLSFGPNLTQQLKMSFEELETLPRWGWRGGLQNYGNYPQRLFTYHPINFRRTAKSKGYSDLYESDVSSQFLYGMLRETNFPTEGQMTLWRFRNFNLQTLEYELDKGVVDSEYFAG